MSTEPVATRRCIALLEHATNGETTRETYDSYVEAGEAAQERLAELEEAGYRINETYHGIYAIAYPSDGVSPILMLELVEYGEDA